MKLKKKSFTNKRKSFLQIMSDSVSSIRFLVVLLLYLQAIKNINVKNWLTFFRATYTQKEDNQCCLFQSECHLVEWYRVLSSSAYLYPIFKKLNNVCSKAYNLACIFFSAEVQRREFNQSIEKVYVITLLIKNIMSCHQTDFMTINLANVNKYKLSVNNLKIYLSDIIYGVFFINTSGKKSCN